MEAGRVIFCREWALVVCRGRVEVLLLVALEIAIKGGWGVFLVLGMAKRRLFLEIELAVAIGGCVGLRVSEP